MRFDCARNNKKNNLFEIQTSCMLSNTLLFLHHRQKKNKNKILISKKLLQKPDFSEIFLMMMKMRYSMRRIFHISLVNCCAAIIDGCSKRKKAPNVYNKSQQMYALNIEHSNALHSFLSRTLATGKHR